jgi:proline iminopeptidase
MVPVNGVQLFTRTVGEGPDVVVLHGGPGAHHDYLLPQYDALARGRRLRYYDQRGGGRSPVERETPLGWREHVEDLAGVLEHWDIGRATLLGYSWGGLLALLFATVYPRAVGRLALVSPAAASAAGRAEFERRFAARMQDPAVLEAREALRRSGLRERDPDGYQRRAFELSVAGYFRDITEARNLTAFRVTHRAQQAAWESLGDYDLRDALRRLEVTALVVHGEHDPIPIETARETAELLGARFEPIPGAGHVPHVETFDRFVEVLDAFLPRAP